VFHFDSNHEAAGMLNDWRNIPHHQNVFKEKISQSSCLLSISTRPMAPKRSI
jgi:hypothetical protein